MTNISYSLGEGESIYTDITIIGNNISIKISLYDDKTTIYLHKYYIDWEPKQCILTIIFHMV